MQLDNNQIQELLAQNPGWQVQNGRLVLAIKFEDFKQSMAFINKVADLAEKQGHHPDIFISYNQVKLELFSHDQGFLSDKDADLARAISGIAA